MDVDEEDESEYMDEGESDADDDDAADDHESTCRLCGEVGDLVLCDTCPASWHQECAGLHHVPRGNWSCPQCPQAGTKAETSRRSSSTSRASTNTSALTSSRSAKRSASSAMSAMCQQVLQELSRHDDAWPFLTPVDTKEVPDYLDIVK